MNDWGSRHGLWDEGGAIDPDDYLQLSKQLIKRLKEQSEIFHLHYSADTGIWSSDAVRLQHQNEITNLASQLKLSLPEYVELTHIPWEHGVQPYVVEPPSSKN